MNGFYAALIAFGAAIPAALTAVVVSGRRFSGKIKSSEAVTLWEAQENFRKDLMARNERLRERLDMCEKALKASEDRLDELESVNAELRIENGELKAKLVEYDALIEKLRGRIAALEAHNKKQAIRIQELEEHNA